jgi:hypothetical protein
VPVLCNPDPACGIPCGQVAQLVEQWTENPRVGGSIPPLATIIPGDFAPPLLHPKIILTIVSILATASCSLPHGCIPE